MGLTVHGEWLWAQLLTDLVSAQSPSSRLIITVVMTLLEVAEEEMKYLNPAFQDCQHFRNWFGESRNRGFKITENQHIIACSRREAAGDAISGLDVNLIHCYQLVSLEFASSNSFPQIVTSIICGGGGNILVNCLNK